MFAFLLLLLTPRVQKYVPVNKDIKEPDYDLDSAPGLDLDNVYKLPILCRDANDGNDTHHMSTGKDDDKVQEPEEVPANDSSSSSSEASTKLCITDKNKGPLTMNYFTLKILIS